MILVTGASGGLGGLVLERLAATGAVLAGSRTPHRVVTGADVRRLDFDTPASLVSGFRGAEVVLLISAGQGEDDTVITRHGAAIDAAERAGVGHIVYTSLTGAGDCLALALTHRWTERRLMAGRADWTILRNGLYAELAVPGATHAAATGRYDGPMGDGQWAAVAREDLADVAAKITADAASHRGRIYELVGDRAVSGADIARTVGGATGRDVSYEPTDLTQLREGLTRAGLPAWQVPTVVSSFANIAAGFLADTGGDLPALLDAPPRSALAVLAAALS